MKDETKSRIESAYAAGQLGWQHGFSRGDADDFPPGWSWREDRWHYSPDGGMFAVQVPKDSAQIESGLELAGF